MKFMTIDKNYKSVITIPILKYGWTIIVISIEIS